jgi:membrane associated rhomboid family serine protease
MLSQIADQLSASITLLQKNLPFMLSLIAGLWCIHLINWILGGRLMVLGVYPRKWFTALGIFFYPFIHGNFNHLFFNSIPLFILGSFVLLLGYPSFYCVTVTIIVLSGLATWLLGRPGFHIGASGLIMGYWAFLLINAYFNQVSVLTVAPAIVCVYYFGGFLFQLFPTDIKTSFEAHLFGALAGIAAYYACPVFYCKFSTYLCGHIT